MKLTHHISLRYIGVTVLVMLISLPIFYFVLQNVLTNNIDESLQDQKILIISKLQNLKTENFVNFEDQINIEKNPQEIQSEKLFTDNVYNNVDKEMESFRILQFSVKTSKNNFNVRVKQSLVESEDLMKTILYLLISILLILTATLFLINYEIKKKVWKPFYKTIEQLKNFRVDNLHGLNLKSSKISEFNDLNFSLNELSANNKKVYQSQKEFTENASHELQTPLAIVQNNIELFWQTDGISSTQAKILDDISNATVRMSKLNQSLLLLSKIENKQFSETQNVNFNDITHQFLTNYQEQIKFKSLKLKTDFKELFTAEFDFNLAEILIGNLLLNALKYSPKESLIEINFSKNEIRISNNAEENSLDSEKLFKRFQRQNHQEKGTGLGLEIAKKIADSFNVKLNYKFENNRHFFILNKN
jgi:signal transduction histidine kinase